MISDERNKGSGVPIDDISSSKSEVYLHSFTYDEVKIITNHFPNEPHKGFIHDDFRPGLKAQYVAVYFGFDQPKEQNEWMEKIKYRGELTHPNLAKLIGYCCEKNDRALVYEYVTQGDLDNHLFGGDSETLPWLTRIKIALGVAKGLFFLHEQSKPLVFGNLTAENIFLNDDFESKLYDFDFGRERPVVYGCRFHVIYADHDLPKSFMTGPWTTMTDVNHFGEVLLELLTGTRSFYNTLPSSTLKRMSYRRVNSIMDQRLKGEYSTKGAKIAMKLAYQCISLRRETSMMETTVKVLESILDIDDIQEHQGSTLCMNFLKKW